MDSLRVRPPICACKITKKNYLLQIYRSKMHFLVMKYAPHAPVSV